MKTYYIITFGCQANLADSERIAGKLKAKGYKPAESAEKANLIVINGCSVRQSAIDRLYAKINKYKSANGKKKIIMAGCILESDKKKLKNKVNEIWHPDEYFDFTPIRSNPNSAQIPIMTGCENFCSYCAVPQTRGRERSRSAKDIINEVKNLTKNGYKEIWLLGQNVNSYNASLKKHCKNSLAEATAEARSIKKINFAALLKKINNIRGDFKIYFMSSHPKDLSNEMIEAIADSEKVVKEIHLPIQSGDNEILKKMNRNYTVEHYKKLVKKIRKKIPDIAISTDIIVGFPSETKKQFQNTVKLAKEIKFDKAYVSKYSPRSGTVAFKIKDNITVEEKKRRWKILNEIVNSSS